MALVEIIFIIILCSEGNKGFFLVNEALKLKNNVGFTVITLVIDIINGSW